jgi:selenocysteine lyase/cysteine desulfurase
MSMTVYQDAFNIEPDISYLNHAAVSPWAIRTQQAVATFAHENATSGATNYLSWMRVEKDLRLKLAQLLGLENSDEIALAKSTSEALSIIAYGIDWQPGDEVLICDQEFPSNRIVWESLASRGVTLRIVPVTDNDPAESICAAISPATRLISVSSVQYASGLRTKLLSLSAACKQSNILLCVDAIQSLGALPFDQTEIDADFIVADGHKWLMAAEGLALLYVKREHIPKLSLHQFGWHMVEAKGAYDKHTWEPALDATRFECGSPNMLGIHALHASLGLLLEIGIDNIEQALSAKVDYLIEQLEAIEGVRILSPKARDIRAGIVTFTAVQKESSELYAELMKQKVICANRGGGVRFSPHFYTPNESMDRAIEILKRLLSA